MVWASKEVGVLSLSRSREWAKTLAYTFYYLKIKLGFTTAKDAIDETWWKDSFANALSGVRETMSKNGKLIISSEEEEESSSSDSDDSEEVETENEDQKDASSCSDYDQDDELLFASVSKKYLKVS